MAPACDAFWPRPRTAIGAGRGAACGGAGAGTMMPGETPPPAGTAAAACTNCGVLQQVARGRRPSGAGAPAWGGVFAEGCGRGAAGRAAGGWEAMGPQSSLPMQRELGWRVGQTGSVEGATVASFSRAERQRVAAVSGRAQRDPPVDSGRILWSCLDAVEGVSSIIHFRSSAVKLFNSITLWAMSVSPLNDQEGPAETSEGGGGLLTCLE